MTRALLAAGLILGTNVVAAQERATTESGRVVLLYADGTWKFASATPERDGAHVRPADATAKIALAGGRASLFYDPTKWQLDRSETEPGRAQLDHANGDGYAVVIGERIAMTTNALRDMVLSNAREAMPDAAITHDEYRTVNGQNVRVLQMEGSSRGVQFVFLGYYYAGAQGTFQVMTYTANNLFEEYRADFEALLDGFVLEP